MKKVIIIIAALMVAAGLQAGNFKKVEVTDLTLVGKAFDTPNPYHRIDTVVYKGFTRGENAQCRYPAGLAVLFKTNAKYIGVCADFIQKNTQQYRSYKGFDLYIKKDGKWLWAGCNSMDVRYENGNVMKLVSDMAEGEKECIMYLPLNSEITSCKVCVPEDATLEALESPFRHKIVFHGSSFTHGISTTRGGMSYPMQFMRRTGMQVIPLGFSGNCRMQPYFAKVIEDIEADAYVFDPFSNPNIKTIRERLIPFIDRMVKAHPGKPIIIQRTIYWEKENFDTSAQREFQGRRNLSDSLMAVISKDKKYKDVYYIKPDAALKNGESSTADGVHPNDNGYSLWEASIEKPVLKILRKYGIR